VVMVHAAHTLAIDVRLTKERKTFFMRGTLGLDVPPCN
jgi:hypothetical protein